jgi:2-methylcitrate dehydratase PrpD
MDVIFRVFYSVVLGLVVTACSQNPTSSPAEAEEPVASPVPLARSIAASIDSAKFENLAPDVRQRSILALEDNAATLAYSSCKTPPHAFLARLSAKGGAEETTLPGGIERLPMEEAAAYIAYLIHAAETDDTDHRASLRASPVVIAPALAVAEASGASGEDLLTAIAIGYSVLGALGEPTGPIQTQGLMSASVYGTISSAAVASYLLELDEEQTQHAVSLAASAGNGLFQYYFDQSDEKRIVIARSARIGVEAALLAQAGEEGAPFILEGRSGLYPVLTGTSLSKAQIETMVAKIAALDGPLHIEPKFYATSDSIIPYLKGIDALDMPLVVEEVDYFELVADKRYGVVLEDKIVNYHPPRTALGAKLNFNFVVSLLLHRGSVLPQHYDSAGLRNPEVLELARKGRFTAMDQDGFPKLLIHMRRGNTITVTPEFPDRSAYVPAYEDQRAEKIRQLTDTLWSDDERSKALTDIRGVASEETAGAWIRRYQARFCLPRKN